MTNADTTLQQMADPETGQSAVDGPPAGRRRWRGLRIGFVIAIAAIVGGYLLLFVTFAQGIVAIDTPDDVAADGIVVLTGGKARVLEALRLLEDGRADRLLISGVHPGTTRAQLAAVTESELPLQECCVDLDKVALNTEGNATETANWARKNGFRSLLVVTSAYHLPRATLELSGALPNVRLVPYPVYADSLDLERWYLRPKTIRLLMREYVKYIVARLRIVGRNLF